MRMYVRQRRIEKKGSQRTMFGMEIYVQIQIWRNKMRMCCVSQLETNEEKSNHEFVAMTLLAHLSHEKLTHQKYPYIAFVPFFSFHKVHLTRLSMINYTFSL